MIFGPLSSTTDSGPPLFFYAWMTFVLSFIGWSAWRDLLRRRAIRSYALGIGLRSANGIIPTFVPLAEAGANGRPREVTACYTGIHHGFEIAIYDLRIGSGKHVRRKTIVGVELKQPEEFRPPSPQTLLGFEYEREYAWVLVILMPTIEDANQIGEIVDYLTAAKEIGPHSRDPSRLPLNHANRTHSV